MKQFFAKKNTTVKRYGKEFLFPKVQGFNFSRIVATIGKFELIRKLTLNVISQLTP